MKKFLSILSFLTISTLSFAQFGVTGGYSFLNNKTWQEDFVNVQNNTLQEEFTNGDFSLGLNYWFRLKNYRVEFLPELTYRSFDGTYLISGEENGLVKNDVKMYGFHFNTQIYPFDIEGDCDCPTWSKEGPTLKKGLFINISPGVDLLAPKTETEGEFTGFISPNDKNTIQANLGLGLGFDIGLSDFLTITPLAEYRIFFDKSLTSSDGTEGIRQVTAGVRIGVRLD